jgi:hypothetical protein
MSMILGLVTLSDANIGRLIADPPLVWQLVAPDDRQAYEAARRASAGAPGLFGRLLRKRPELPADLHLGEHEGVHVDLDKAWHGIHYLLTGTAWEGTPPLSFLLDGGQTAGDLEVGYGAVRMHVAADVKRIHQQLHALNDRDLRSRFRPDQMMKLEIYPEIWDRPPEDDDTLGYLMAYVAVLREQVATTAARGLGLAISLS